MLNPSRQQRLTIEQVEKHQWVFGVFIEEFSALDEKWKEKTFQKYVKDYEFTTVEQVSEEIEKNPFGSLGGIFNIEKHAQQMKEFALRRATSACKMREIKVINQISSIDPSQISTSLSGVGTAKRPIDA